MLAVRNRGGGGSVGSGGGENVTALAWFALTAAAKLARLDCTLLPDQHRVGRALGVDRRCERVGRLDPTVTVWPAVGSGTATLNDPDGRDALAPPARSPARRRPQSRRLIRQGIAAWRQFAAPGG